MDISCHCNNVSISVDAPQQVTQCSCSICSRYMALWGYYEPGMPTIRIGNAGVQSYSWGDREIDFIRCAHCGCVTHYTTKPGVPRPRVAVNFGLARELIKHIPIRYFDGANEL